MAPRVGIFGKVGAGNIGNDASMEAVLGFLREQHPDAVTDAMCTGPDTVRARYGIDAVPLLWHHKFPQPPQWPSTPLKVLGKGVDAARTAAWVRHHDVVIVPGAGVLEASLPMLPRGFPYALFLLSVSGKALGVKVALVGVGAGAVNQPLTRWLMNSAAKLAFYRSYRDPGAREAMRRRGLDTSADHVYPDLAFSLPASAAGVAGRGPVAVGVMAYRGTNDDRKQAQDIYSHYVGQMKRFVQWLVDSGREVVLIVGDTNGSDDAVAREIMAGLRAPRPGHTAPQVRAAAVSTYADVMRALEPVGSVVAIRYHNILCALKLCKPTISIGYSPKHDVLMSEMGLPGYALAVSALDVGELMARFTELEEHSAELRRTMMERNEAKARLSREHFAELTDRLFAPGSVAQASKARTTAGAAVPGGADD
jgi:polysaccharide pyruvyl transferase WcaK-like protein